VGEDLVDQLRYNVDLAIQNPFQHIILASSRMKKLLSILVVGSNCYSINTSHWSKVVNIGK